MDRRRGVGQPPGYPFSLNSAVDTLLKKEFDHYRNLQKPHPLMEKFGIDAVPFNHEKMDEWRDSLRKGIQYLHPQTNLLITGGVDDIWINPKKELIVVDYKATSKNEEIIALDKDWQDGYKRQAEIYQWLLRQNGFTVISTAYFVYANGDTAAESFNNTLKFVTRVIPYTGKTDWIEAVIYNIKKCLDAPAPPPSGADCDFCLYRNALKNAA